MLSTCNILQERRSAIFFKAFDIVKKLEGASLMKDIVLLSNDHMEAEIGQLRITWGT